jgi:TonB family protein
MPDPPKKAEAPGKDKLTVPAIKPAVPTPTPENKPEEPPPVQTLVIPAQTMAAGATTSPGALESNGASQSISQGSGSGGGVGTGTGTGIGPGQGSGLGPGYGGGTGGGAYRPGNGVENPRLLRDVKPQYTAEAMRAKVQGAVLLECVVLPDGTVGSVTVKKSLDKTFGLDEEAIKAAKQWRFAPGTRLGEPVPVLVTIELSFALR